MGIFFLFLLCLGLVTCSNENPLLVPIICTSGLGVVNRPAPVAQVPNPAPVAQLPNLAPNLGQVPAVAQSQSLSWSQIGTLVLVAVIIFSAIFGVFLFMPRSGILNRFENQLAVANEARPAGSDNAILLESCALMRLNGAFCGKKSVGDLCKKYPVKEVLAQDDFKRIWLSRGDFSWVVVKELSTNLHRQEIENELQMVELLQKYPDMRLRPAFEYYYGQDSSFIVSHRGHSWSCMAESEAMPFEHHLYIMYEVLGALKHMHEKMGMVHGNLHPNNILIGSDGIPDLIDFGHSRRIQDSANVHEEIRNFVSRSAALILELKRLSYDELPENTPDWLREVLKYVWRGQLQTAEGVLSILREHNPRNPVYCPICD